MFPDLITDDVFRLETRCLWLRWPRAADAPAIERYAGQREVAEMTIQVPHPYPAGAAAEFILRSRAANMSGRSLTLMLASKARPFEAIGCIGLDARDKSEPALGYWLARPFWGQGLMSEAARELIDLTFRLTDLEALQAQTRPGNERSARILRSCGFVVEDVGIEPAMARGGAIPVERFRLPRSVWLQRRERSIQARPAPALMLA